MKALIVATLAALAIHVAAGDAAWAAPTVWTGFAAATGANVYDAPGGALHDPETGRRGGRTGTPGGCDPGAD